MRISDWSSDVCSSDLPFANQTPQSITLAKAIISGEARRWHSPRRAACDAPGGKVRLRPHPAAFASHRPAKPVFQAEGNGIRQTAVAVALQLHPLPPRHFRSEEHTSELQSPMRISYAVFCLK